MRVKKEKGFRRIEIVDSNYENSKNSFYDIPHKKCFFCLVIFAIFLFIFLIFEIIYLIHTNDNSTKILDLESNDDNIVNKNKNINKTLEKSYVVQNSVSYIFNNVENNQNTKKIYDIYNKAYKEVKNPKITIIIIVNDNKYDNIERLLESIYDQNFIEIEILIIDDNINKDNKIIYDKIQKIDKRLKIIEYGKIIGKLKRRIEGINKSNGEYIIFLDSDDYFSSPNVLSKIYTSAINDKIDILEFKSFHWIQCKDSSPINQPQIFDIMYFGNDNFNNLKQFHITGKIIQKEFFMNVLNNMDNFYKEQNMTYFEESMILFILFKKAKSFEMLRIQGTVKSCSYCDYNIYFGNGKIINDYLLYLKFMTQYSEDNVPEKRLLATLFLNNIVRRNSIVVNNDNVNLLKQIINFFLISEKVSDEDKQRIKKYQNYINSNEKPN